MSEQPQQTDQATGQQPAPQQAAQQARQQGGQHPADQQEHVVVVGPDGQPVGAVPASALAGASGDGGDRQLVDLVEQPAKVMRIGGMIRQLLEEVKAAPLDEASRARLRDIHQASVKELEDGLAPELVDELERLSLPFTEEGTPSEGELRVAQAQLVGWLEGLFHGIQTAIYAQQVAARAQLEQMRRALPMGEGMAGAPGQGQPGQGQPGQAHPGQGHPGQGQQGQGQPGQGQSAPTDPQGESGGMYL